MMAVDRSKHVRNNVICVLHALCVQAVGCIIITTVASCFPSHTEHVNAFCPRDMEILNSKPCDTLKTTGT
jgi:hypothetical protein